MRRRRLGLWFGWGTLALLAILAVAVLAFNLPAYFRALGTPCAAGAGAAQPIGSTEASAGPQCEAGQLLPAEAAELAALGLSLNTYAVFTLGIYLTLTAACWGVAALLVARRANEPVTLLAAMMLVSQGTSGVMSSENLSDFWNAVFLVVLVIWFVAVVNFLYVFPDGRFVPRWTRWAFVPWGLAVVGGLAWVVVTVAEPPRAYWTTLILITIGLFVLGGLAQIYRYQRVSTPVQRQQTKWVVAGLMLFVLSEVVWALYSDVLAPLAGWALPTGLGLKVAASVVGTAVQLVVPVTIGAAVLRYRLWDIDLVIQRTLVYSVLTALLTATYFVSVVVLQEAAALVTGQRGSELVTVLSTLLIAALFMPLRASVQRFIDRRFFRRKYDAARTLAQFGANLRDDVDLAHLRETLLRAVAEVMQPEQVRLWIRLDDQHDIGEDVVYRWSDHVQRAQD